MKWHAVLALVIALTSACSRHEPTDQLASSSEAFDLSSSEFAQVKAKAEQGDPDAAYRLGEYFSFVKKDRQEAIRWYKIPANSGNVSAMNALTFHYIGINTEASCSQASVWLDKALIAADEKYTAENYLRARRDRLRWDGANCIH